MATTTSLGMNIWSRFRKEGVKSAINWVDRLEKKVNDANKNLFVATGRANGLVTSLVSMAPAATGAAAGVTLLGGALVASGAAAGGAATAYGVAMKGAITHAQEMHEAGEKLTAAQARFIKKTDALTESWHGFIHATEGVTLNTTGRFIDGAIIGLGKLVPLVKATDTVVGRLADSWVKWVKGPTADALIHDLSTMGVTSLEQFRIAAENMFHVVVRGFRDFLPLGEEVAEAIKKGAENLNAWAQGGGFERFVTRVEPLLPDLAKLLGAVGRLLAKIGEAMFDLAPSAIKVATAIADLLAGMSVGTIQAFFFAFVGAKWIATAAAAIGHFLVIVKLLGITLKMTPIGWLILGLTALAVAIVWIATKTDWFQKLWAWLWPNVKSIAKAVWDWLQMAWNKVIGALLTAWNWFKDTFGPTWNAIWGTAKSVAISVWNALKKAWEAVVIFIRDAYNGFIKPVVEAFMNVWPEVVAFFKSVWEEIGPFLSTVFNQITGLFRWLFNVIWNIVKWFVERIVPVFVMAWEIIVSVFKAAIDLIVGIAKAFGSFFLSIWRPLWDVVQTVFVSVWNVLKAVWRTVVDFFEMVLLIFLAFFTGNWEKAWRAIKDFFASVWNQIKVVFGAVIDILWSGIKAFLSMLLSAWKTVWGIIVSVFRFVWDTIVGVFVAVWNYIKTQWTAFLNFLKSLWEGIWNGINSFFRGLWANLILWIAEKWNNLKNNFATVLRVIGETWNKVWTAVGNFFRDAWNKLVSFIVTGWERFRAPFIGFSSWVRNGFWGPIHRFFTETMPNAFNTAVEAIRRAWEGLKNIVMAPVKWIIDVVYNKGIVPMWNMVAGLFGAKKLTPMYMGPANVNGTSSGQGRGGGGVQRLATGGPVVGPGTGTSDSIRAMLSNGEHVWTAAEVRAAGGHSAVERLRKQAVGKGAINAMIPGKEATGGFWGWIGDQLGKLAGLARGGVHAVIKPLADGMATGAKAVLRTVIPGEPGFEGALTSGIDKMKNTMLDWIKGKDTPPPPAPGVGGNISAPVAGAMTWQQMWSIVRGAFPDGILTSSYRPGDPGWHGRGRAIDVAWPMTAHGKARMVMLSKWIASRYPGSTELIHTPGVNLHNGRSHVYSAGTAAGHYDHVHWAMGGRDYGTGTPAARRGIHVVGDRGPEIVNFRGGERVWNNSRTVDMLSGDGGSTTDITVNIDARGATSEAVDKLNRETIPQLRRALGQGVGKRKG